jgi:hypothetical protein
MSEWNQRLASRLECLREVFDAYHSSMTHLDLGLERKNP